MLWRALAVALPERTTKATHTKITAMAAVAAVSLADKVVTMDAVVVAVVVTREASAVVVDVVVAPKGTVEMVVPLEEGTVASLKAV